MNEPSTKNAYRPCGTSTVILHLLYRTKPVHARVLASLRSHQLGPANSPYGRFIFKSTQYGVLPRFIFTPSDAFTVLSSIDRESRDFDLVLSSVWLAV